MANKEKNIKVRVDCKTYEILQTNIEKKNQQLKKKLNTSEYIRQLIARDSMEEFGIDREKLTHSIRVLAGLGNNINQIAHNMNMDIYNLNDKENLEKGLNEIQDIKFCIMEIVKKLF